jgi:hypothetical protein
MPTIRAIAPAPTEEEATAIAVAMEALWPRPVATAAAPAADLAWRFSGRWWGGTAVSRRSRPAR